MVQKPHLISTVTSHHMKYPPLFTQKCVLTAGQAMRKALNGFSASKGIPSHELKVHIVFLSWMGTKATTRQNSSYSAKNTRLLRSVCHPIYPIFFSHWMLAVLCRLKRRILFLLDVRPQTPTPVEEAPELPNLCSKDPKQSN